MLELQDCADLRNVLRIGRKLRLHRDQTQLHGHPSAEAKEGLVCTECAEARVLLPGQLVEEQAGEDSRYDGASDEEGEWSSISVDAGSRNSCAGRDQRC